jgi:hypothetical protein
MICAETFADIKERLEVCGQAQSRGRGRGSRGLVRCRRHAALTSHAAQPRCAMANPQQLRGRLLAEARAWPSARSGARVRVWVSCAF